MNQPNPSPLTPSLTEDKTQVLEHLVELRRRLIWCMVALAAATFVCYQFSDHIFSFLIRPLADTMGQDGGTHRMIYTSMGEAFFTTLKLSFLTALLITLPFILIQIWKFVAPGLYKRERKAFRPFLVATPLLFLAGASLVYYVVMPLAWAFFLGFQTSASETVLPIQLEPRVGDYLSLIISLIFAFGLCFQLPVFLMLLARAGFITTKSLTSRRKYALVLAFIIGGVMTPPDVISQISLAVPLLALYEISILMIRHAEKSRDLPE